MNSKETPEQIAAKARAKMAQQLAQKAAESRRASNSGNTNINQISEEKAAASVPGPSTINSSNNDNTNSNQIAEEKAASASATTVNPSNKEPKRSFCCCF
ncbi:hypothetical protein IHE45_07G014900 [Dioscorea alata]|uniref:Uncharacterized protein n=1 Tax=Dioscorea alata TaxID=55571 RepID=A0ACB7VPN8_DIOAL|nr:hypothetical protein IHE45_07G014900 [Dioscorea alata]